MGRLTDILGKVLLGRENSEQKGVKIEHKLAGMFRKSLRAWHSKNLASQERGEEYVARQRPDMSGYHVCQSFRAFEILHCSCFLFTMVFLPSNLGALRPGLCLYLSTLHYIFQMLSMMFATQLFLNKYMNE